MQRFHRPPSTRFRAAKKKRVPPSRTLQLAPPLISAGTFPVSSASSSMKRERSARCNAKTPWAICCRGQHGFPFITDKGWGLFYSRQTICHSVYLGNKRSGLPDEPKRKRGAIRHSGSTVRQEEKLSFLHLHHTVIASHHYSIIPLSIRIGRAALLRSTSCPLYMFPLPPRWGDGKGNVRGVWSKVPRCRGYG